MIIPCKWEWDNEWYNEFKEDLLVVYNDSQKYGYIDKTGKEVIPCKWAYAWNFSLGMAIVFDENDKCGFIDKTGKLVVPCTWLMARDFSDDVNL